MEERKDLKLLVLLLRELREWGQVELAEAAGMDASSICRYERGRTIPPRRTLERLATAVGLPTSFVDACLLPVLKAACDASATASDPGFADLERAGAGLARVLGGIGGSALAAFPSTLEEREPWRRTGPPEEKDRQQALDLWARLEPCTPEERRYLVETCREFQTWALAERLCHESEEAAPDRAGRALELAGLAHRVAELAPGETAWRSRLEGYALAFLANARRAANDLPGAEEAFGRAWKLWEAGTDADPGLLAEGRLLDLEPPLPRGREGARSRGGPYSS